MYVYTHTHTHIPIHIHHSFVLTPPTPTQSLFLTPFSPFCTLPYSCCSEKLNQKEKPGLVILPAGCSHQVLSHMCWRVCWRDRSPGGLGPTRWN